MVDLGLARPTTEKLKELASGDWNFPTQPSEASKSQMKNLRVPLESTECGKDHSILWQIYIWFDEDIGVLQQTIIGQYCTVRLNVSAKSLQCGKCVNHLKCVEFGRILDPASTKI